MRNKNFVWGHVTKYVHNNLKVCKFLVVKLNLL